MSTPSEYARVLRERDELRRLCAIAARAIRQRRVHETWPALGSLADRLERASEGEP